jgi:hypothetical protein
MPWISAMSSLSQIMTYIVSPLATLLAVWVAYIAVLRGSQPQLLIYYQPNPDIPSLIDLIVENSGGAGAINVILSEPLPINCFGIEKSNGRGSSVPHSGFPMVSARQRYVFNGGQYAGLAERLGEGLKIDAFYHYRNPLGFRQKGKESFVLSIKHLKGMPTRTSANQAIVDALKGPNKTTIQEIRDELRAMNKSLNFIVQQRTEPTRREDV